MEMTDPLKRVREAYEAQCAYCNENNLPVFISGGAFPGQCSRCYGNVFMGADAYTVEKAGRQLITSCPHCNASFCE